MPKFLCRCSYVIDRSPIPCPDEWLSINDVVYDKTFSGMINSDSLYRAMTKSVKCPNCGRLWFFCKRGQPASCYKPEGLEDVPETIDSRPRPDKPAVWD